MGARPGVGQKAGGAHQHVSFSAVLITGVLTGYFFLNEHAATLPYKLSWRQQMVPVTVAALDATMKRARA